MSRSSRAPQGRAAKPSPAQVITAAIIAKLENGVNPWRKPWTSAGNQRPLRAGGQPYRGINTVWLWMVAEQHGYTMPTWMTYRQAEALGGQVRRGARGTIAVFYKSYGASEEDAATGETNAVTRRVLRTYTVFNVAQIDDLPERFTTPPPPRAICDERHRAEIDAFIAGSGAVILTGGDRACYDPSRDLIHMPRWQDFESYALYGATAAHELSHWTGAKSRLDRDLKGRFGSDSYAAEELVAEISAAMLGTELGLPWGHLDNHASYVASWLKILKADERALMTAAAKAEEAASYLLSRCQSADSEQDDGDTTEEAPVGDSGT